MCSVSDSAGTFRHPGLTIGAGFAGAIAVGTAALSLPVAHSDRTRPPLLDALFTATSAVCVTGLIVVDTETYWTGFGQVVILILIQLGGLGLMTVATLLAIVLARRLGLRARLLAQAETKAVTAADLRRVVRNIVVFSLVVEAIVAVVLSTRFILAYGQTPAEAVYSGVFHAVSAFNNAGFSLHADNLMRYVADPWVNAVVAAAVIIGGLGSRVVVTPTLRLDLAEHVAERDGQRVHLTPTEWRMVEALTRRPGALVRQAELLGEVWGPSYDKESNYLRVFMAQLRRKLEPEPSRPRHFVTEPGVGHRFVL